MYFEGVTKVKKPNILYTVTNINGFCFSEKYKASIKSAK